MTTVFKLMGSLKMAVVLLITIGTLLAWGTIYETRFGTAAVQRAVYTAWWFQAILAFLAVNLAMAALRRYPWKRRHTPFLLAHVGIILILVGGIIGGRFGIEGQLVIPEGQVGSTLLLPRKELVVHQANPDVHHVFPTSFDAQAWVREPQTTFVVHHEGRRIDLTVDRYLPDAAIDEQISGEGDEEYPAVRLVFERDIQQDTFWLMSRDPERFGMGWAEAHVLFLEPETDEQVAQLVSPPPVVEDGRGIVSLTFAGEERAHDIPVPEQFGQTMPIAETPYRITFKDYFPDFAIGDQGLVSRSNEPNNPAVSFVLTGPEGTDPYLLFAGRPEIAAIHGWEHSINAEVAYRHSAAAALPPNAIVLIRVPAGTLSAILTGTAGQVRQIDSIEVDAFYAHPWLDYRFKVAAYVPKAKVVQEVIGRSDEVRSEALHLVAREGDRVAEDWVGIGDRVNLVLGDDPIAVEYKQSEYALPFTVKLLDFRKITYPGIDMAAGFESDVELTDAERGIILIRKIEMNEPLKHRGFSLFQSSFIPGAVETTVLSVRNDPGTPLVYTGFLIVIFGVASMFVLRARSAKSPPTQE